MATKKISGITGELILDVNKWSSGIKAAQKDSKALESALKPMKELASSVGTGMVAAGAVIGGALLGISKRAADVGDKFGDLSKRTGIGVQSLAGYSLAASKSGTSIESLAGGVNILSKNIYAAAT